MIKIFKYQMGYTFRKKSSFIFIVFLFLVSVLIPWLVFSLAKKEIEYTHTKFEVIFTAGPFSAILIPIVLLFILYIGLQVGNIFKRGEGDGTTLMLVSSRFVRSDVIFGRFLATLAHVVIASFFVAIGMCIATLTTPSKSIGSEWVATLSIFAGSIFVGMFFAGISMICAITFGRVGTIIISSFIGTLLPISSLVIVLMTSASDAKFHLAHAKENTDDYMSKYDKPAQYIYNDSNSYKIQTVYGGYTFRNSIMSAQNSKYNLWGWFDVWGQMSEMFSLFNKPTSVVTSADKVIMGSLRDSNPNYWKEVTNSDLNNGKPWRTFAFDLNSFSAYSMQSNTFLRGVNQLIQSSDFANKVKDAEDKISYIQRNVDILARNTQWPNLSNVLSELDEENFLATIVAIEKSGVDFKSVRQIKITNISDQNLSAEKKYTAKIVLKDNSEKDISEDVNKYYSNLYNFTQHKMADMDLLKEEFLYILAYFEVNKSDWSYAFENSEVEGFGDISGIQQFKQVLHPYDENNTSSPVTYEGYMSYSLAKNHSNLNQFIFEGTRGKAEKPWIQTSENISGYETNEVIYGQTFSVKPIVPKGFKLVFWPALALGLFGVAFLIHKRADFK